MPIRQCLHLLETDKQGGSQDPDISSRATMRHRHQQEKDEEVEEEKKEDYAGGL